MLDLYHAMAASCAYEQTQRGLWPRCFKSHQLPSALNRPARILSIVRDPEVLSSPELTLRVAMKRIRMEALLNGVVCQRADEVLSFSLTLCSP